MKLTIESTDDIVELDGGHPARVWRGVDEKGQEVLVFVASIAVPSTADNTQFEAELVEQVPQ